MKPVHNLLPYPNNIENDADMNHIQLVNSNYWNESCLDENNELNEVDETEENIIPAVENITTVPLNLINLPIK